MVMNTTGPQSGFIPVEFGARRPQRADAVRNRRRVLEAARHLIAQHGVAVVTMDAIADAAGVGKGTVYRAFAGRGRLAEALVDDAERTLQAAVMSGAPPLGPGAEPHQRLQAFVDAYLHFLDANTELLIETDHHLPGGRFAAGAHSFWRTHVAALAGELGCEHPPLTAELILALLTADLHHHLSNDGGVRPADTRSTVLQAAAALVRRC